ncbi:MAG: methylmalonyl-CoA mutase family protein [Hyphomicrobiales bacterium]|nr:methylmalonyl-CoA mutase family protein [Hyphomicrobiales bacterium]
MTLKSLASGFPAIGRGDWAKQARGAAAPSEPWAEGIVVNPLYDAADAGAPYPSHVRGGARGWSIIQFVDHLDFADANRQLREDLANGTTGLWLQLGGNIPYGGAYLGARTADELREVFDGVDLSACEIYVSGGFDAIPGVAIACALAEAMSVPHSQLRGSAGLDPLSIIAASGYIPADRGSSMADCVDAALWLRGAGSGLTPFLASGRAWHQAGGSASQELAFTLAASAAYWRELERAGLSTAEAFAAVDVMLAAESDLFLTIAKFRAARLLWARAAEAAGAATAPVRLLAEMSYRGVTERDAHVNLLRGAAAVFGACVGGASGALVIPFNTRAGTPDAFGRRMARNTQLVLTREAHLGRVADAAGGSWYVETLTRRLAEAAWAEFRAVEAHGGLLAALEAGHVYDAVTPVRQKRERRVALGADQITGVSSFPDLREKVPAYHALKEPFDIETLNREGPPLDLPAPGEGARFAAMVAAAKSGAPLRGLERALETVYDRRVLIPAGAERIAEPFERLRRASDLALFRVGARPPVFVALFGSAAEHTARLTWVRSFFEAGGVEVLTASGDGGPDELQRAFRESPAPVACLCSSDAQYAANAGAARALKAAGASALYVVGGAEALAQFSAADQRAIDRILYPGCDMLSNLMELHQIMHVDEMGAAAYEDYDLEEDA